MNTTKQDQKKKERLPEVGQVLIPKKRDNIVYYDFTSKNRGDEFH